ncbi:MAG TPA: T9SS type A sorting domain-containing protein [Flavipsychrobacter sp.]|nr:T9SS type A sorting domain-containing protein [Flavipsychrobacter sp.]
MLRLIIILLLANVLSSLATAQVLDSSFGINGIVKMPFEPNGGGSINSVTQQQDGKIVALGGAFRVIRYHLNGIVDSSFAVNGRLVKNFDSGHSESANNIVVQPDNKIVISGDLYVGSQDFAVARFNQDGTPDFSFNGTGDIIVDIYGHDACNDAALQADGKIILCGSAKSTDSVVIMRLNTDGSLDTTFSNQRGIFTASYGIWSSALNAVIVKPDGKILACGNVNNNSTDFLLVQLLPDGQLDSAFGNNGVVVTSNTGFGHDFALQHDGKIVIVGRDVATGGHIVRYHPDGSIDNSFGTNGHVLITHSLGIPGPEQVEIDNNGKIYAAGHITTTGADPDEDMFLIRLNSDGTVDSDYAPDGIITQVTLYTERTHGLLLQTDGRVLMAGYVNINAATRQLCMLRFWPFSLSVNSVAAENRMRVFPNPATDMLHLVIPGITQEDCVYTIVNSTGQILQQGAVTSSKINIANIPKGMLIVQITNRTSGFTTYTRFCKL